MTNVTSLAPSTHVRVEELLRVAMSAVTKAQKECRRQAVPNVYSIDGCLYYETPSGDLSVSDPFETNPSNDV
ncbi:MAG: hypothetical protein MI757_21180 [Pirellulales bacterium]|nr:hypothetical protein [Pirellulales bacterium]